MSGPKIVIIDYGVGNVRSMKNAFLKLGAAPVISAAHAEIRAADGLVLPGVGAFPRGMKNLRERDLVGPLRDYIGSGRPFLGVCLGMQLLLDVGHEFSQTKGLGVIAGQVRKMTLPAGRAERLPNIGWKKLAEPAAGRWRGTILDGAAGRDFYFVHSYAAAPDNAADILATSEFAGQPFVAALQKDNVIGAQFHPEKSADGGLNVITAFLDRC